MSNIVTINNLSKKYGKKLILDQLSFTLDTGKVIGLLGENGAGKTTLIKILANLCKADKGSVVINGKEVSSSTHNEVSYLLDSNNLYPWMRVKHAIDYYEDMFPDFNKEKSLAICEQLQISTKEYISRLSKGNVEKVLLMLAISRRVPLYLFDEPVAGLDPKVKKSIIQIILSNIDENATVLISSHLLKDLEGIFDDILILHKHKISSISADYIRENYHKSVEDYYLEVTEHD
ncbi:MAG: transporter related [Anaerocolumna sp.]|jgi:ABC-2 type transport system ATP-binding protein|nr:transporter related [Anaerocolumna sp.]